MAKRNLKTRKNQLREKGEEEHLRQMESFGEGKQERGGRASHMSQGNGMCLPGTVSYEDGEVRSGSG